MKKFDHFDVKAQKVEMAGAKDVTVRWLITKETGAENFAMRLFEMNSSGHTPLHTHDWEHEIYILDGNGVVRGGDEEKEFRKGDVIFIPPNERHQLRNAGDDEVRFLCLIPYKD